MMLETLLLAAVLQQPLVQNPRQVAFTCPDHALDDQHEMDIVRTSDGVVIQTLQLGDPPMNEQGEVVASINVQPVTFGTYVVRVRVIAGTLRSIDSTDSNQWVRAPGQAGSVTVRE